MGLLGLYNMIPLFFSQRGSGHYMGVDNGSIITGRIREHHITSSSDIGAARLLFRLCGKSIKLLYTNGWDFLCAGRDMRRAQLRR